MDLRDNIYVPFGLSVLIHFMFVMMMVTSAARLPLAPSLPIEVDVIRPEAAPAAPAPPAAAPAPGAGAPAVEPPQVKNQIVSPPDSPEAEPKDPKFLSDKNSRAEEEMVKRGQPAPPAEPPRTAAKKQAGPKEESRGARGERGRARPMEDRVLEPKRDTRPNLPGLPDLFARPSEIIKDPRLAGREDGMADDGEGLGNRDLAKLSRPELWADPGERGTLDVLPEIRQGKFTLLNTKADLFAPFVRRVGLRVFQTFSMDFKRMIFAGSVPQGKEKLEIEAVMSKDGRRLEVALKRRDGNLSSDRVMLATINDQIFFDENPPPGAVAADGRIHFVFALDAAVWYQATEHGVQPGAQWIFGAGLL